MTQIESLAAFSPEALGELALWLQPFFFNTTGNGNGTGGGWFWGNLDSSGGITSGSGGYSVVHTTTGLYTITFDVDTFSVPTPVACSAGSTMFVSARTPTVSGFVIEAWDLSGALADVATGFIVAV